MKTINKDFEVREFIDDSNEERKSSMLISENDTLRIKEIYNSEFKDDPS